MFRLRITLLSVLLSGIVLFAFGLFFLSMTSKINLDKIDREIVTLGESQLVVLHPREHWENFEASLKVIYGPHNIKKRIVRVIIAGGFDLYISSNWPDQISVDAFSEFDKTLIPPPRPSPDGTIPKQPRRITSPDSIKSPLFRTFHLPDRDWRVGIMGNSHFIILVGIDLTAYQKDAKVYSTLFFIAIPIALLLLAAGGWVVAHRALAPVRLIARTTESITAKGLHKRIPDHGSFSEFKKLIQMINEMLDRLETSFNQAARFSADAAHELQTPLTILQGVLDEAVRHSPDGSEEQQRCSNLLEEVRRLKVIVRKLLLLSRADAGRLNLITEPVNLSQMTEDIIEDISIMAPDLDIKHYLAGDICVEADPDLLRQVIQNLASNAVKHNIKNGTIWFTLKEDGNSAVLQVANTGNPISNEDRKRIFDRFYRVDKARSNKVPGAGLGLSLAKEITRAHKGRLSVRTDPEKGVIVFKLKLFKQK